MEGREEGEEEEGRQEEEEAEVKTTRRKVRIPSGAQRGLCKALQRQMTRSHAYTHRGRRWPLSQ